MKKVIDGSVPDRCYYYLLDFNDYMDPNRQLMESFFNKHRLMDLTVEEF